MIGVDFGGTGIKAGIVKDGKVVDKQIGNVPRAALEAKIQKLL